MDRVRFGKEKTNLCPSLIVRNKGETALLFRTGSIDVIKECRSYFGIELHSCSVKKKTRQVLSRYNCAKNLFCRHCGKL